MSDLTTSDVRSRLRSARKAETPTNAPRDSAGDGALTQPSALSEGKFTLICRYCVLLYMLLCLLSPHFVITFCCLYVMVLLLCW
jgi:hypothetical protein